LANHSKSQYLTVAGAGLFLGLVLAGLHLIGKGGFHPQAGSTSQSFVRAARAVVTVPGIVEFPALSPDGKQIAFTWRSPARPRDDLYVQLIGADQPLRITHNTSGFICCADWSPDGQQITYGRCDDNGGAVFVVPALGGVERKIADVDCPFNVAGTPQWTADGKSLLLADRCTPNSVRGIVLFSLVTGERRCLTSPPPGGDLGDFGPILSPNQKTVAFHRSTTLNRNDVYIVDLSGKNLRQLTQIGSVSCGPMMWTQDGKYVVFDSSANQVGRPSRVSAEGGPIEPATTFPAVGKLSRDGRRLIYGDGSPSSSTWHVELAAAGGTVLSVKNISLSSVFEDSPQLSLDGKHLLVKSLRGEGNPEIWRTDFDGQNPIQVTKTDRGWVGSPHWSPDGKWIVMDYRPEDHSQIWMIDSEGRNFHAVIADQYENFVPRWSRDGRSIYFTSNRSGEWQLWKLDPASDQKTLITDHGGISALESYDGSTLYYAKRESGGIFSRSISGGPEARVIDGLHVNYWGAFAVTKGGIYFVDSEAAPRPMIYYYDFRTRKSDQVLPLERMPMAADPSLTASPDGREIVFTQQDSTSHINLAEASP
jgi:Tol biopolymer transport system component